MTGRNYPIPRPADDDPRFTFGLAYDIAQRIEQAAYPPVTGADLVRLELALFRFIYTSATCEERAS